MYGVDISAHQAADTVKQLATKGKAAFVITRNSCGSYTPDSDLAAFMADINRYSLKNSAYVASYAKDEAEAVEEADFLVSLVEKYGNRPELPLFFDWEYFSADYIKNKFGIVATKELVQKITVAFCERIKEHGYTAGVYCNLDFMQRFYTPEFWAAHPDYKLWYARPGLAKPDKDCYLWQYASNNGHDDFGYNGDIDKNILYGEYVDEIEPMKPLSSEPIRMLIGFASVGDIHTLTVKLKGLGIPVEEKDGFIITGYMSSGDQCYIMTDCHRLGVAYKIYDENEDVKPMKLKIGFASSGDIFSIKKKLEELGIVDYTEQDGFIITNIELSAGDVATMQKFCDSLGIPCVEYIEETDEVAELKERLAKAQKEISDLKLELEMRNNDISILEDIIKKAAEILNSVI